MNKSFLVGLREYHENLRTKTFWIGVFFFPVVLVLSIVVPVWLEDKKEIRRYAIVDDSAWIAEAALQEAALPDLEKIFRSAREGDFDYEGVPDGVAKFLQNLDKLPEEQLPLVARGLVQAQREIAANPTLLQQVPGAQREWLQEFIDWWRSLSSEQARELDSLELARQKYEQVQVPADASSPRDWAAEEMKAGRLFAWFEIEGDPIDGDGKFLYHAQNLTDQSLENWFERHVTEVVRRHRFDQAEIDDELRAKLIARVEFSDIILDKDTGESRQAEDKDTAAQFLPVVFVYMLWISVMVVAQMLLTNTIEEKSNRTIEVLLSSISPLQLMSGKIGGIAATGLTVVLSWLVFFLLVMKVGLPLFDVEPPFDLAPLLGNPVYLGSFVGYFLLGYLLYAGLLVGIGSVCNSLKEAQNLVIPVNVVMMVPLLTMFPIVNDPNSALAKFLSYVPPFTPFVMMNRAAGPPTATEYLLTTLLLLFSIAIVFFAAAKVFRIGILMTGKPPRMGEILRWIRAPIGAMPERPDDTK